MLSFSSQPFVPLYFGIGHLDYSSFYDRDIVYRFITFVNYFDKIDAI